MQRRTNKYLFRVRKSLIRKFLCKPQIFVHFLAKLQRKRNSKRKQLCPRTASTELSLKIVPKIVSLPRIYLLQIKPEHVNL
jgi:hypothetical protein